MGGGGSARVAQRTRPRVASSAPTDGRGRLIPSPGLVRPPFVSLDAQFDGREGSTRAFLASPPPDQPLHATTPRAIGGRSRDRQRVAQRIDAAKGTDLWRSDGTTTGTKLVKDIAVGPPSSSPRAMARLGTKLVFFADDGVNGLEPWTYTPLGSGRRVGLRPGPGPGTGSGAEAEAASARLDRRIGQAWWRQVR